MWGWVPLRNHQTAMSPEANVFTNLKVPINCLLAPQASLDTVEAVAGHAHDIPGRTDQGQFPGGKEVQPLLPGVWRHVGHSSELIDTSGNSKQSDNICPSFESKILVQVSSVCLYIFLVPSLKEQVESVFWLWAVYLTFS